LKTKVNSFLKHYRQLHKGFCFIGAIDPSTSVLIISTKLYEPLLFLFLLDIVIVRIWKKEINKSF
jgi:hypothetical protein